jgi:hypothetical protein
MINDIKDIFIIKINYKLILKVYFNYKRITK